MSKKAKNTIVTLTALILIGVAAVLSMSLLMEDKLLDTKGTQPQSEIQPVETTEAYEGLIPVVNGKYLWEYGWQQIAAQRPSAVTTVKNEESSSDYLKLTLVEESKTYYEVVTNWKGEAVTDENGNAVTEVHAMPQTERYTEYVTDKNGEKVTDANGKPVTEVHTKVVATTLKPVVVTNENGDEMTDNHGNVVTEKTTTARTTAIVGNTGSAGAKHWAQGITDGEKYIQMKIYIEGKYTPSKNAAMTMTLREKSGLVAMPNNLVYNINKGTCSTSPGKSYSEMAYVSYDGDRTVVTLIIPEKVRPNTGSTTTFKASSTRNTFYGEDGNSLAEFTVSIL